MIDEQQQVLQMVQSGTITPAQAEALLDALGKLDQPAAPDKPRRKPKPSPAALVQGEDFSLRRYWEVPLVIGLILLVLGLTFTSIVSALLLVVCGWVVFVIATVVVLASLWSRSAPWAHVRIHKRSGKRIHFSLPLPLWLMSSVLHFARRYVDDDTTESIDLAANLLRAFKDAPLDEPLSVEVNEEDGDHVLIYIS
ncbi:MAG: hypothetical protein JXJ20_07280 [Anaerolineae bacterium]|nr:hypothetical protein [Anaerolineae bacterium]